MPDDFRIEHNVELSARELDVLARFLVDLRSFWPMVSRRVVGWIGRQFDSQGDYWGDPWAPLSPEYAAWKSQAYPGKGILSAEGDLRRAATSPSREVTPRSLTMTIEPYDKSGREMDPGWFQEGTDRMPARPLIGALLTPEMDAELRLAADEYVDDLVRRLRTLG